MKKLEINNYESLRDRIHILNPDTGEFVKVEDWAKDPDPTRAQIVAIDTPFYRLALYKKSLGQGSYEEAQERAAEFSIKGFQGAFRCPRRNEGNYIYDARFYGLDEAMRLIGGDRLDFRFWTCEKDADPRYSTSSAWIFIGYYGLAADNSFYGAYQVIASTLLPLPEAD